MYSGLPAVRDVLVVEDGLSATGSRRVAVALAAAVVTVGRAARPVQSQDSLVVGHGDGVAARSTPMPEVEDGIPVAGAARDLVRVDPLAIMAVRRRPLGHVAAVVVTGHKAALLAKKADVPLPRSSVGIVDHDGSPLLVDRRQNIGIPLVFVFRVD